MPGKRDKYDLETPDISVVLVGNDVSPTAEDFLIEVTKTWSPHQPEQEETAEMSGGKLLALPLGEAESDMKAVKLVFFINVFHEFLEVFSRLIGFYSFSGHFNILNYLVLQQIIIT
jgi:hypothetical protein